MSVPDTLAATQLAGLLGMWHVSLLLIGEGALGSLKQGEMSGELRQEEGGQLYVRDI